MKAGTEYTLYKRSQSNNEAVKLSFLNGMQGLFVTSRASPGCANKCAYSW